MATITVQDTDICISTVGLSPNPVEVTMPVKISVGVGECKGALSTNTLGFAEEKTKEPFCIAKNSVCDGEYPDYTFSGFNSVMKRWIFDFSELRNFSNQKLTITCVNNTNLDVSVSAYQGTKYTTSTGVTTGGQTVGSTIYLAPSKGVIYNIDLSALPDANYLCLIFGRRYGSSAYVFDADAHANVYFEDYTQDTGILTDADGSVLLIK